MSQSEARKRHLAREPYAAVLGKNGRAMFSVEVSKEFVSVDFFDHLIRKYLSYSFHRIEPDRLFLGIAYYWEYEGNSENETAKKIISFSQDGTMFLSEEDVVAGTVYEREKRGMLR